MLPVKVSLHLMLIYSAIALAVSVGSSKAGPCRDLAVKIHTTAETVIFPSSLDPTTLKPQELGDVTTFPRASMSGDYIIAATYCEPKSGRESRKSTLQLLLHGITYDKSYWIGKNYNNTAYSWVNYASTLGYPTLAIDRICNGDSSKPNGLLICQVPTNAAVVHEIIQKARSGQVNTGRAFSKVVIVAHSEGSVIANFHSQTYPHDADAYILTGFTNHLLFSSVGDFLAIKPLPTSQVDFARFGDLTLDPSYLTATDANGVRGIFYFGSINQQVVDYDFETRGAFPVGEFLTAPLGQLPATEYAGPVFILNGEEDQIFCAVLPTDPAIGGRGRCGTGTMSFSAQTQSLYPKAKSYNWVQIPNTGHNVNLHYSASETFRLSHDFLISEGF